MRSVIPAPQSRGIRQAVESAFLDGVSVSRLVCAGVALAAAAVAVILPPRTNSQEPEKEPTAAALLQSQVATGGGPPCTS